MADPQADEFADIHSALGIRPFTPDALAAPSPLMSEMQAAPGKIASGVGGALGITDAVNALRGNMTPEEQQGFALTSAAGLLPMGRAEKGAELAWNAVKPVIEDAWKAGRPPTGALTDFLSQHVTNPFKHIAENYPEYDNFLDHLNDKYGDWADIMYANNKTPKTMAQMAKEQGQIYPPINETALSNPAVQASLSDEAIEKHLAKNPGASLADVAGLSAKTDLPEGYTLEPSGAGHFLKAPSGYYVAYADNMADHQKAAQDYIKYLAHPPSNPPTANFGNDLKSADFGKYITPIENWQEQLSSNTPRTNPLEFDTVEARERARQQGYNVDLPLFKGGHWSSYQDELLDPKKKKSWEPGLFFSDDPEIARSYTSGGAPALPYVARAHNPMEVHWPTATGLDDYNSGHMNAILHAARDKGADMVVVRDMHDMGGAQDQYVVLDPKIVRQPGAEFAPDKMDLAKLAAGIGGVGVVAKSAQNEETK